MTALVKTPLANFRSQARGGQTQQQQHDILPDTTQPGVSVTHRFPFQSYYDDALLQTAILQQSKNEPIVNTLTPTIGARTPMLQTGVPGYCIGLHPSSQTPVAVQPLVGGQATSSQAVILKPGQIYRPHGKPFMKNGNFSGVNWGIPFGWLGGGLATLYIFSSPDADVAWPGNHEIIFHRQRMQIIACQEGLVPVPSNWPLTFPWLAAERGPTPIDQSGASIIAVEPTKTLMSLRLPSLGAPAEMRINTYGSDDFDLDANMVTDPAVSRFTTYIWGTYDPCIGTAYPVVQGPTEWTQLGCNNDDNSNGVILASAVQSIQGAFVDVCRYGRL